MTKSRKMTAEESAYAPINCLNMYCEIHGTERQIRPLVLLHGALSAIETSFGKIIPSLSKIRPRIAVEQRVHGHTADIDCPLTIKQMADDTVALLRQLGIEIVRSGHAAHMFRLLGDDMAGDLAGLRRSRLAVLPGTTHVMLTDRVDWLVPIVEEFLDAPVPDALSL